jgi:toxin ParE1/3/4
VPYRVLWSASARERMIEFLDFIAEENPAAAKRVVGNLRQRVGTLADQPRLGRLLSEETDPDLRRLVVGNYLVVYRIQEARQVIDVVGIRHFRERSLPGEDA